jgi:hypothetical protein
MNKMAFQHHTLDLMMNNGNSIQWNKYLATMIQKLKHIATQKQKTSIFMNTDHPVLPLEQMDLLTQL